MLDTPVSPPAAPAAHRRAAARASGDRPPPSSRARLLVALLLGLTVGAYRFAYAHSLSPRPDGGTMDFAPVWAAARAFWQGADPYTAVGPGRAFEWVAPVVYPAPAFVIAGPLAGLSLPLAAAVFVGAGAALLAWMVTARTWAGLLAFASFPVCFAVLSAQWSLALTAAVLPPLAWLVAAKPTLGLALAAYRPTPRWLAVAIGGGAGLALIAWARQPGWVAAWLEATRAPMPPSFGGVGDGLSALYAPAVTVWGGPLLLLALLRWRRPEARLLAVLACVPLTPTGYELVPLVALVPRSRGGWLVLGVTSWLAYLAVAVFGPYPSLVASFGASRLAFVVGVYLPALALVLRRPNEGAVPVWSVRVRRRAVREADA